jgi:hypothetical protein
MKIFNCKSRFEIFLSKKIGLLKNIDFWSAISGFVGTLLTFYYGLPDEIHADGHGRLLLEPIDQSQIQLALVYWLLSHLGLVLLALSFGLQVFGVVRRFEDKTE